MTNRSRFLFLLIALCALPAAAENWSLGGATGAFVFGDFYERTLRVGAGPEAGTITTTLSAATRAGLAVDIERRFSDRFAIRLEGTFTDAPLALKGGNEAVGVEAGNVDVTTFILPLVINLNTGGSFRFHILGGPAYATYDSERRGNVSSVFQGSRSEFGGAAGAGLAWWLSDRFAVEGQVVYIATRSPFKREDFPASTTGLDIPKTQNVHTTVGVRLRF